MDLHKSVPKRDYGVGRELQGTRIKSGFCSVEAYLASHLVALLSLNYLEKTRMQKKVHGIRKSHGASRGERGIEMGRYRH